MDESIEELIARIENDPVQFAGIKQSEEYPGIAKIIKNNKGASPEELIELAWVDPPVKAEITKYILDLKSAGLLDKDIILRLGAVVRVIRQECEGKE